MDLGVPASEKVRQCGMAPLSRPTQQGLRLRSLFSNTHCRREDTSLSVYLSQKKNAKLPPRAIFYGCDKYRICISGVFFAHGELSTDWRAVSGALAMCRALD